MARLDLQKIAFIWRNRHKHRRLVNERRRQNVKRQQQKRGKLSGWEFIRKRQPLHEILQ